MSAVPARRSRAEAQRETQERLLDAATIEFAEHGLEGTSIDAITARAGFSRGAFYSNFDDKADLLVALAERRVGAFVAEELGPLLALPHAERAAALARWLVTEDEPREVLLLAELARLAPSAPGAAEALEGVLATVSTTIADALARAAAVDGGTGAPRRAIDADRVQAIAIATLGVRMMRAMQGAIAVGPVTVLLEALIDHDGEDVR
ncbi:MAG: hypothetical protein RLZZ272_1166 [Actinomycetota bacterium]|jgi:AcrR family transcriptional regulator